MKICYACKKELTLDRKVGRKDECPFCRADLHCCLNCRFYDPSAPKQCREPVAELIKVKDRANFCDYFVFAESRTAGTAASEAERARKAFDELFKK